MSNPHYQSLDKLVTEYEEDSKTFQSDRQIMINYPKIFLLSTASSFEHYIKQDIDQFISNPIHPINTHYPNLVASEAQVIASGKSASDKMYKKFYTMNPSTGVTELSAEEFYKFFDGSTFKADLEMNFSRILTAAVADLDVLIQGLTDGDNPLIEQKDQYMLDYIKYDDIKKLIQNCTFSTAESAFLELKLRRNRIAHNYFFTLYDTFIDLTNFYYKAILYVVSLENTLKLHTANPR